MIANIITKEINGSHSLKVLYIKQAFCKDVHTSFEMK